MKTFDLLRRFARAEDRGDVSGYVILMLPALVGLAGLTHDAGLLFEARRDAQGIAAAAARAGANDIDKDSLYVDGLPSLSASATQTARSFAIRYGDFSSVEAVKMNEQRVVGNLESGDRIRVVVTGQSPTLFLGMVGYHSFSYRSEAIAVAQLNLVEESDDLG